MGRRARVVLARGAQVPHARHCRRGRLCAPRRREHAGWPGGHSASRRASDTLEARCQQPCRPARAPLPSGTARLQRAPRRTRHGRRAAHARARTHAHFGARRWPRHRGRGRRCRRPALAARRWQPRGPARQALRERASDTAAAKESSNRNAAKLQKKAKRLRGRALEAGDPPTPGAAQTMGLCCWLTNACVGVALFVLLGYALPQVRGPRAARAAGARARARRAPRSHTRGC